MHHRPCQRRRGAFYGRLSFTRSSSPPRPRAPSSLQRLTIFGSDRRHSGHFWRSLEMSKMTLLGHEVRFFVAMHPLTLRSCYTYSAILDPWCEPHDAPRVHHADRRFSSGVAVRGARTARRPDARRLGVLMALAENDAEGKKYIASFVQGLHDLGWTEGGNIRTEYRWAGTDVDRIRVAAGELLDLKPDAILAMTPLAVAPLRQMTATVPIVFVQGQSFEFKRNLIIPLAAPNSVTTTRRGFKGSARRSWSYAAPRPSPAGGKTAGQHA